MSRLIKSLAFYPVVLVGGLILAVLRVLGWFCLVGCVLIGVFWLAGELIISGWIVASVGVGGVIALTAADLFTEFLACLNLAGRGR